MEQSSGQSTHSQSNQQSSGESTRTQSNQRRSGENTQTQSNLSDSFGKDELIAAGALLDLSTPIEFGYREKPEEGKDDVNLTAVSESVPPPVFGWGCKRKRSANGWRPAPSSPPRRPHSPSPPPLESEIGGEKVHKVQAKAQASSPSTPLSYPPSASDGRLKRKIHKSAKKRKGDESLNTADELVQCKASLRKALADVRSYYTHVKALNSALKVMKQELSSNGNAKPHMKITNSSSLGLESSHSSLRRPWSSTPVQIQDLPQIHYVVQQEPCIVNQTVANGSSYGGLSPVLSSGPILGVEAPLRLPDLNAEPEESNLFGVDSLQPLDLSGDAEKKAKAAEVRRFRMSRLKEVRRSRSPAGTAASDISPLRSK